MFANQMEVYTPLDGGTRDAGGPGGRCEPASSGKPASAPDPVIDLTAEELRQIMASISWAGPGWEDSGTHVYAVRRGQNKGLDRKTARVIFRGRRVQLSTLLMLAFRKPSAHESMVRMKNGCADRACVNPFHFNLGTQLLEKRRLRRFEQCAVPGSSLERALLKNSWLLVGDTRQTSPPSCGDETPSFRSSPFAGEFSALTSEVETSEHD